MTASRGVDPQTPEPEDRDETARWIQRLDAAGLATRHLGRSLHAWREVDSTNDMAAHLAASGAPSGTLVLAHTQRGGRGRLNRTWESPPGGLWMSLILRPDSRPEWLPGLTLVVASAVAAAIEEVTGLPARVRWPNDIYVRGRKVGGLLAESRWLGDRLEACWIGIGLDVNIEEGAFTDAVAARAGSLRVLTGGLVASDRLLAVLLGRVEADYDRFCQVGFNEMGSEIAARCETLGHEVEIDTADGGSLTGMARGLGPQGALEVADGTRVITVWTCDEVRLLPG